MKLLDPIIIIGLLVGAATKSQQFQVVKYTQGFVEYAACAETTSQVYYIAGVSILKGLE
jgi:hypothetical protein